MGCWNVAGWGNGLNCRFRHNIIHRVNLDVICLVETHLVSDSSIHIPGYSWFGNNRKTLSKRARWDSGGVGILVNDSLLSYYSISILDSRFEGILWVQYIHIDSSNAQDFCTCVCYLPPSNSCRGDNASEFFAHLNSTICYF